MMRKLWHRLFGHPWNDHPYTHYADDGTTAVVTSIWRPGICSCGLLCEEAPPIAYGLVSVNGVLYTATLDTSKKIILRQSEDGGVTWTASTTPVTDKPNWYRWDAQDNG